MAQASREFQVFVKPAGAVCNLDCHYCYHLKKKHLYPDVESFRMPESLLEKYIVQHIEAAPGQSVLFSWHGGEPTILGLEYFRKIAALQRRHMPPGRRILNGIQTNGILLDEEWCRFLSAEGFGVGLSLDGPAEIHDLYRATKGQGPSHKQTMRAFELLQGHAVPTDILCVVHDRSVRFPRQVYRFFKEIGARYVDFLVAGQEAAGAGQSPCSVPSQESGSQNEPQRSLPLRERPEIQEMLHGPDEMTISPNPYRGICLFRCDRRCPTRWDVAHGCGIEYARLRRGRIVGMRRSLSLDYS